VPLRHLLSGPRAIVRAAGFDIVRYAPPGIGLVDARRLAAIRRGNVAAVLDVGAAIGDFGRKLRASGYDGEIVSFEPVSASFDVLREAAGRDPRWRSVHSAVGDIAGEAEINVSGTAVSSSLLPMEALHLETVPASRYERRETVRVQTLDTLVSELPPAIRSGPFYLKIDVQGYEARVLDGAAQTLTRTPAIELEVSLRPLYRGSILFRDVLARLDALGFSLISWEDVLVDRETQFALQADCIFVI
jgi:FkbM family methyltransferase